MPNPYGFIWDEFHGAGGPPGWDPQLYGPWEDVRMLLTFVPSRMRSVPDRAVVLMCKPLHLPPPNANPLGLRPVSLQHLMSYCCGSAQVNSCSVSERLVGACSHCVLALREAPPKLSPGSKGHCPNGEGVSTLARMVWGTYLEKNCLSSNGHFSLMSKVIFTKMNPDIDGFYELEKEETCFPSSAR